MKEIRQNIQNTRTNFLFISIKKLSLQHFKKFKEKRACSQVEINGCGEICRHARLGSSVRVAGSSPSIRTILGLVLLNETFFIELI